ncbi:copper-binding protein [Variovorax saccharolyticus]|uniref:copper-binding protein n=1 Tax=Variovorax saccharolyticus TaxID=3053516 RepID=UPI002574A34A|nr:copper-binding protein [Variovorax sp. J22R187]MDM0022012.1 copper-binding protein [Variovorax sp. J22R187]
MKYTLHHTALAALLALAAAGATAADSHAGGHDHDHGAASAGPSGGQPAAAAADLSEGEIRKIDLDTKRLTLKHGPLKNLDMAGMTMVFQIKDPAQLEKLQVGEKVRFRAEKIDGKLTVTRIEPQAR